MWKIQPEYFSWSGYLSAGKVHTRINLSKREDIRIVKAVHCAKSISQLGERRALESRGPLFVILISWKPTFIAPWCWHCPTFRCRRVFPELRRFWPHPDVMSFRSLQFSRKLQQPWALISVEAVRPLSGVDGCRPRQRQWRQQWPRWRWHGDFYEPFHVFSHAAWCCTSVETCWH